MTQEDLKNIIAGGEDSRTEFKSVGFHNDGMAKAVVAFANMQGGRILVGVEDDGRISGIDHPAEQVERLVNIYHYPTVDSRHQCGLGRRSKDLSRDRGQGAG